MNFQILIFKHLDLISNYKLQISNCYAWPSICFIFFEKDLCKTPGSFPLLILLLDILDFLCPRFWCENITLPVFVTLNLLLTDFLIFFFMLSFLIRAYHFDKLSSLKMFSFFNF